MTTTIGKLHRNIVENIMFIPTLVTSLTQPIIRGIQKSSPRLSSKTSFSLNPKNLKSNLSKSLSQKKDEFKKKVSNEINAVKSFGSSTIRGGSRRKTQKKQTRKSKVSNRNKRKYRKTRKN